MRNVYHKKYEADEKKGVPSMPTPGLSSGISVGRLYVRAFRVIFPPLNPEPSRSGGPVHINATSSFKGDLRPGASVGDAGTRV